MNYEETLSFLYTKLPMYQRQGAAALKFNLDNITALMQELGNPHLKVKTIHIAGTNGKGSSAHMLSSILQEAGLKTGLHTSPHLKSFTERIRINGDEIPEQAVVDFIDKISGSIESIKPSFFEISFAMAMDYFAKFQVDIAIIEVGMGGRLDSTNIISPKVCLITNISMDHQYLLGDTLKKIAAEKAGIIKPHVPVVVGQTQDEVNSVFVERAEELAAPFQYADQKFLIEQAYGGRFNVSNGQEIIYEGILPDLKGSYQLLNVPGVLAVCEILHQQGMKIKESAISDGLENVIRNTGLKGRWQQLSKNPLVIADTGHNEAGISEIMRQLDLEEYKQLHIVWGMVNDKEATTILNILPKDAAYYFVKPDIPRGLPVEELNKIAYASGLNGKAYNSVREGITAARSAASRADMVFIGGSTFVVADIEEI